MKSTESAEGKKAATVTPAMVTLAPNPENRCFGCGGANESGMKLTFVQDNERRRIVGRFVWASGIRVAEAWDTVESLLRSWMKRWEKFAAFAKFAP